MKQFRVENLSRNRTGVQKRNYRCIRNYAQKRDGTRLVLLCSSSNVLDGGRQRTSGSCRSKFDESHCLMSEGQSVVRSRSGASSGWADRITSSTSSSSSGAAG